MEDVMLQNQVVIKYKNRTSSKGKTSDFFPNKNEFHLEDISGEINKILVKVRNQTY